MAKARRRIARREIVIARDSMPTLLPAAFGAGLAI